MKKFVFSLSILLATVSSSVYAAPATSGGANSPSPALPPSQQGQMMQGGQMMQAPDCSQLTQAEQDFANQIMDMNNRTMFCSEFSSQQRQQAMQMMGQPDSSGNMMNADQAVQQVNGSGSMMAPTSQQKPRSSGGGCPVK